MVQARNRNAPVMQVFLPYPDVHHSLRVLDMKRLGKQRSECKILLSVIDEPRAGWHNHPASVMFRGHTRFLMYYHDCCITEWTRRGYKNNMALYDKDDYTALFPAELPWWFGSLHFHSSHQDNLLRKDPEHYAPIFGDPWTQHGHYYWPKEKLNTFVVGTTGRTVTVPFTRMKLNVSPRTTL